MEVFGGWGLWPDTWASDDQGEGNAPDDIDCAEYPRELRPTYILEGEESVGFDPIGNYDRLVIDRRLEKMTDYLRTHESDGRAEWNIITIYQKYSPKSIIAGNSGMLYAMGQSTQSMTLEARIAASGRSFLDLDISN